MTWLLELSDLFCLLKNAWCTPFNGRYGVMFVFFVNDLNHVLTNRSRNIKSLYSPASPGGCQRRVQAWTFAVWHGELFLVGTENGWPGVSCQCNLWWWWWWWYFHKHPALTWLLRFWPSKSANLDWSPKTCWVFSLNYLWVVLWS